MLNKFLARIIVSIGALIVAILSGWFFSILVEWNLPWFVYFPLAIILAFVWAGVMIVGIGSWFMELDD
jgi:uncharacterized membrane protein YesL